ncbi:hypothetical protein FRC12_008462 [Ceratobasidium sp. 428]|nr:hypothetical protein FRC12_008462 [Ceratobasidium sp. 428]
MHYLGKAPPANSNLTLQPILPQSFDRFDRRPNHASNDSTPVHYNASAYTGQLKTRGSLEPATSNISTALNQVHPEGSCVYSHGQLVSDDILASNLLDVGEQIVEKCNFHKFSDITVFLRRKGATVEYYAVDHQEKTVRWASDQKHESLSGMTPSREHNILKEEYWTHMENFPGVRPVEASCVQDLKDVLASLAIDSETSDGSTSPFSTRQIKTFLSCLNSLGHDTNEYQTYTVARLWNMIWHARAVNSFGGSDACLDRFTVLGEKPEAFSGANQACARLTFGVADAHLARCRRTWAGRIAYVTEWRNFKAKNEKEWAQVTQLASILVLACLLVDHKHKNQCLKMLSTSMAAGSAANGYYLTSESQNMGENAADAAVHFQKWELPSYNIQRLALRNATPQALLIWATLLFIVSVLVSSLT